MSGTFSLFANLVDIPQQTIYPAEVVVRDGKIASISPIPQLDNQPINYILPGFIDSHVHIESSMLVPSEFARLAVVHGTVATVSDPHEIANVCGMEGVEFMIENGKTVPFKFNFGAPSCVPATIFETAGATLDANAVEKLLQHEEIKYLSEMMNFPGVLNGDEEVMKKIAAAHRMGKPVDGHAPGLRGEQARSYIQAPLNPPQGEASPNPSKGGALDSEKSDKHYSSQHKNTGLSAYAKNPPLEGREALAQEGALDPEKSDKHYSSQHKNTGLSAFAKNPPLEGREALAQEGTLDPDNLYINYSYQTAEPGVYGLLKKYVKEHRENPTHAENVLWHLLRGRQLDGYKFRRQHIIGSYIADFVCLTKKLIIEVDGLIHQIPENKNSDAERTVDLNRLGFDVIRFTNEEVSADTNTVLNTIVDMLSQKNFSTTESKNPPLEGREAKVEPVISTDHECFTAEEALDKLKYGMKIIIREGSAAKNFEALIDLLNDYPNQMMFCSDDKHPDSLVEGHINQLCERAVAKGIDIFKVLKAACVNPVLHYKLDVGLLKEGDAADFIVVKNLKKFEVIQTYINGKLVAEEGKSFIKSQKSGVINNFSCDKKEAADFEIPFTTHHSPLAVIEALDGQLITNKLLLEPKVVDGKIVSDVERDILKIVVVNRYNNAPVAKGFIKNVGLKQGALASSVAHDSHNIVAVGVDDESICNAVNMVIEHRGGVSCLNEDVEMIVPLPVAGLMSNEDGYKVAEQYSLIDKASKEAGSTLAAPFMTLSFMALLVIPHLKLSDKGLFDADHFRII